MTPSDFWQPFEVEIKSFFELQEVLGQVMDKAVSDNRRFAWRGQSNAGWGLQASLNRRLHLTSGKTVLEGDLVKREGQILAELHRWGLHASHSTGRLPILSQLAMLQHYGAPTRFLDITFNAWVGAWFAVEKKWSNGEPVHEDIDARLFAVDVTDRLINEQRERRSWEDVLTRPWTATDPELISQKEWTTSVFAWKPPSLDGRIAAQNGGFLFGGVPTTEKPDNKRFQLPKTSTGSEHWTIDEVRQSTCVAIRPNVFNRAKGAKSSTGALYSFRIKADAKRDIRERLDRLFGYRHSTIYPDYTGFASFGTPELKSY
ncbi:MAG: FRG domain-containing protein [Pseudomonadota bacterium]|uniref:FRG domain-containing protein n=1 Tax=Dyella sp. TaxID=1869338 RepID=UPI0034764E44